VTGRKEWKMTVHDVWDVAPQSSIFILHDDGRSEEYQGNGELGDREVALMAGRKYPMYGSVIEIILKD
jgi:hypothetical protein